MRYRHSLPALAALCALLAGPSPAAEEPAGERVLAIQERLFDRHHEVGLLAGFIPDQDFDYAFPVGVNYVFNFDERLAWEVLRAEYVVNQEKDLKKDLEDDFGVTPTAFDKLKYMVHTNLVLKPSYGKDALWNRTVWNHETYVVLGAGLATWEEETSDGDESTETAVSVSVGLGRKWFLTRSLCLNLEVRDLVHFKEDGLENHVYLGLGLGYRFNLAPRRAERDDGVERLKDYLKEGKGNE